MNRLIEIYDVIRNCIQDTFFPAKDGRNKTPLRGATSSELGAYTFPNEQALYWSLLVYIIDRNVDCIYHAENFPGFVFPSS